MLEKALSLFNKRIKAQILVFAVYSLYPISFMFPVLRWNTARRFGPAKSDMNATLSIVQWIDNMRLPFSNNAWFDYPNDASFWSIHRVFQGIQWLLLFVETRFLPPLLSINVFLLLGWITAGVVSYLVARELNQGRFISLWVGLFVQMLPGVRGKLGEHHSFVWISVPLLVVLLSLRFLSKRNTNRFLKCLFAWISTAFFDPHWLYFTAPCILVCGVIWLHSIRLKLLSTVKRYRLPTSTAIMFLVIIFMFLGRKLNYLVNASSKIGMGRSYGIASTEWIDQYSGSLIDYVLPSTSLATHYGGFDPGRGSDNIYFGGLIVGLLCIFGIASKIRFSTFQLRFLLAYTFFLIILPLGNISIFGLNLPPISFFIRYLMPGLRVFIRATLLGQALIVVFAGFGLAHLLSLIRGRNIKILALVLLSAISVFEMNPFAQREIYRGNETFQEFRTLINKKNEPSIFIADGRIFPSFLNSSLYIRPDFFGVPLFNTADNKWRTNSYPCAKEGSEAFASYLSSLGIDFVIAPKDVSGRPFFAGYLQDSTRFITYLNNRNFFELALSDIPKEFLQYGSDDLYILEEFASKSIGLYRVNKSSALYKCTEVTLGQFVATPPLRYVGADVFSPWISSRVSWSSSGEIKINMESFDSDGGLENLLEFDAHIVKGNFVSAEELILEIKINNQVQYLSVPVGAGADLKSVVNYGDVIIIRALNCPIVNFEEATSNCFGFSYFQARVL